MQPRVITGFGFVSTAGKIALKSGKALTGLKVGVSIRCLSFYTENIWFPDTQWTWLWNWSLMLFKEHKLESCAKFETKRMVFIWI